MTIREFFEQRGAQSVLADSIGVTRQNVNLWHSGKIKISIPSAIKVVTALKELGVNTTMTEVVVFFNQRKAEREMREEEEKSE